MASVPNASGPNCPGGGGSNLNQASRADSTVVVVIPFGGGGANSSSSNAQSASNCPPVYISNNTNTNINKTLMNVDNSIIVMNKSSLTSISESVNQMVTNSVTSTTTSASQTVNVQQQININVNGVKGNVYITDISQTATFDLSNSVSMDMTAIDNVRTDLANQVLQQFASSSNTEAMSVAQASMDNEMQLSTQAALTERNQNSIDQVQTSSIPLASPMTLLPVNTAANVNSTQTNLTDITNTTNISNPYTSSTDISRTIQTSVLNSVTQNFTHETVTQLMQAISLSQQMNISVSNVGGDVKIANLSQQANMQLRQTLAAQMDIGTAITNGLTSSLGITTDDRASLKKSDSASLKTASKVRSSSSFSNDVSNAFSYTQSVTSGLPSGGSSGSSTSSFSSCICSFICCVVAPMLGAMLPSPGGSSSESASEEASTDSAEPASAEAPAAEEAAASTTETTSSP
jgi:hypothetical protein